MAGIEGRTGNPGKRRHWAGPGRNPTTATLRAGVMVFVSEVRPEGGVDLGRGIVSEVKRGKGGDRCVIVPLPDGGELHIVIGEND